MMTYPPADQLRAEIAGDTLANASCQEDLTPVAHAGSSEDGVTRVTPTALRRRCKPLATLTPFPRDQRFQQRRALYALAMLSLPAMALYTWLWLLFKLPAHPALHALVACLVGC